MLYKQIVCVICTKMYKLLQYSRKLVPMYTIYQRWVIGILFLSGFCYFLKHDTPELKWDKKNVKITSYYTLCVRSLLNISDNINNNSVFFTINSFFYS